MEDDNQNATKVVLGKNVRRLRRKQKLSQEQLAERAHLSQVSVSAVERGVTATTMDVLDRLAAALEVTPAELISRYQ